MNFCIVIPMHNEEGNVTGIVREVNKALDDNGYRADIILVDDGSEDDTASEIERAGKEHPNIVVRRHERNAGFGAAIKTAMKVAFEGGYIFAVFMDADFTMHPGYIRHFYEKMAEGYDFVIGSRFLEGGGMKNVPGWRKFFSLAGRAVFRICFRLPLTDYTQGFRAIRVKIIEQMRLSEGGFPILIEEIYQARRFTNKFSEIPFVLTGRETGRSKFSYTPKVLWDYLKYAGKALAGKRVFNRRSGNNQHSEEEE
ncbi:MAG: glycosyltransferase [PVC group bacterium]